MSALLTIDDQQHPSEDPQYHKGVIKGIFSLISVMITTATQNTSQPLVPNDTFSASGKF